MIIFKNNNLNSGIGYTIINNNNSRVVDITFTQLDFYFNSLVIQDIENKKAIIENLNVITELSNSQFDMLISQLKSNNVL